MTKRECARRLAPLLARALTRANEPVAEADAATPRTPTRAAVSASTSVPEPAVSARPTGTGTTAKP